VNRRPDLHHTDSFVVIEDYWPAASAAATVSIVAASATCRGRTCSIRTPPRHATPAATTSAYEPAQANWPSRPDLFETDRGDRLQRPGDTTHCRKSTPPGSRYSARPRQACAHRPGHSMARPQVVGQFYCTDYRALTTARKLKRPREVAAAYIFCSLRKHRTPWRLERRRRSGTADPIPAGFRMASGVAA
jgi:hypothetical protein